MINLKDHHKKEGQAESTCSCEFLNKNGSCALARPSKKANVLKLDTQKGICELNGQPLADVVEMNVHLCGDNEAEVTIKTFAQVKSVIGDCNSKLDNAIRLSVQSCHLRDLDRLE